MNGSRSRGQHDDTGTITPKPLVLLPKKARSKVCIPLVVSDGNLIHPPSNVTVTIVPNFASNVLVLNNPPSNPARPTIVAFGGGNCSTGSGITFGGVMEMFKQTGSRK